MKSDLLTVLKSHIILPFAPQNKRVSIDFGLEFIVAPKSVELVGVIHEEIGYRGMMADVFTPDSRAIFEIGLDCLPKDGIKGL
jgi:hypothetical protein